MASVWMVTVLCSYHRFSKVSVCGLDIGSKVTTGYPAALADIKVGDTLIEAEGTDVTKASANLVVTIFK